MCMRIAHQRHHKCKKAETVSRHDRLREYGCRYAGGAIKYCSCALHACIHANTRTPNGVSAHLTCARACDTCVCELAFGRCGSFMHEKARVTISISCQSETSSHYRGNRASSHDRADLNPKFKRLNGKYSGINAKI